MPKIGKKTAAVAVISSLLLFQKTIEDEEKRKLFSFVLSFRRQSEGNELYEDKLKISIVREKKKTEGIEFSVVSDIYSTK